MKAKLKWIDGVCFMAETGSVRHAVVMDGAPEGGGRNFKATSDGAGLGWHRRLHQLRRVGHPKKIPPRRAGLLGGHRC